jgi:hypothetical protein
MKRKFMQWWLTILSISTKQSPLILTHWTHKKDHEYNVGSPDPGLRQAQKCGRVKTVSNYCLFLTKGLYLPWHTKQYSDEMVVGELGCGGSLNKTVYWKSENKSITSMCQHQPAFFRNHVNEWQLFTYVSRLTAFFNIFTGKINRC